MIATSRTAPVAGNRQFRTGFPVGPWMPTPEWSALPRKPDQSPPASWSLRSSNPEPTATATSAISNSRSAARRTSRRFGRPTATRVVRMRIGDSVTSAHHRGCGRSRRVVDRIRSRASSGAPPASSAIQPATTRSNGICSFMPVAPGRLRRARRRRLTSRRAGLRAHGGAGTWPFRPGYPGFRPHRSAGDRGRSGGP